MTNTAAMNETRTNGTQMGEADWICSAFSPISWSAKDTLKTRTQIYENNAVWDEFCGGEGEAGAHDGE